MPFRLQFEDLAGNIERAVEFADGEVRVGRSDECDVTLNSSSVSREHARFFIHLGRAYVEDLRSANGVVVNGTRIRGMEALNGPAVVVVGDHIVRFTPDTAAVRDPFGGGALVLHGEAVHGERTRRLPSVAKVGRSSASDIQIADQSISRLHAELRTEGPSTIVSDLGSANGTFVNGVRIAHPTALSEGDFVQFGDVAAIFTHSPATVDWRAALPPVPGTPPPESNRLLLVAAALAVAVIVCAVLVYVSANRSSHSEADPLQTATAAAEAGNWAAAVVAYEAALESAENSQAVIASLDRARRELAAQNAASACESHLEAAQRLQTSTDTASAIAAYDNVRSCLQAIDPTSSAHEEAKATLAASVTPVLIELHRDAGARALNESRFDQAVESYRSAHRLAVEAGGETSATTVAAELRSAYVAAGNGAFERQDWARAESMLSQAHELGALDTDQNARLATARTNAATAR